MCINLCESVYTHHACTAATESASCWREMCAVHVSCLCHHCRLLLSAPLRHAYIFCICMHQQHNIPLRIHNIQTQTLEVRRVELCKKMNFTATVVPQENTPHEWRNCTQ